MRPWMRWLWIALVVVLFAGCSMGILAGCSQPTQQPDADQKLAEVQAKAAEVPSLWKLLGVVVGLAKGGIDELCKYAEKLARRQELQSTVRHWSIVAAVALGLFALVAGVGKFCGAVPSLWGRALSWVAEQVRWRTIIAAAGLCGGAVALAIWIAPLWSYAVDFGWLLGAVLVFAAGWELSCRRYTGKWAKDDLVRLPKGWQVAPDDLEARLPAGWKLTKG